MELDCTKEEDQTSESSSNENDSPQQSPTHGQTSKRPIEETESEDKPDASTSSGYGTKKRKQYLSTAEFNINSASMKELANDCLDPELASLGVTSFNQNIYEQGVIHQLEAAIEQSTALDSESVESTTTTTSTSDDLEREQQTDTEPKSNELISIKLEETTDTVINFIDEETQSEENDQQADDAAEKQEEEDGEMEMDDPNDDDYIADETELDRMDRIDYSQLKQCLDDDVDQFEEAPESCYVPKKRKWSPISVDSKDKAKSTPASAERKQILDDGDVKLFQERIAKHRLFLIETGLDTDEAYNEIIDIGDQLRIPKRIWERLFTHQQESLRWLWARHRDLSGGIVGDEMGLGKTIQIIAFFVALRHTKYREVGHLYHKLGPVLLVCPATVMHQWVDEFHTWWPSFRVAILHGTTTYRGDKKKLIREIFKACGILITSYNGICNYSKELNALDWHYVVLDEGHKIRNPDAMVTHSCKLVRPWLRLLQSFSNRSPFLPLGENVPSTDLIWLTNSKQSPRTVVSL